MQSGDMPALRPCLGLRPVLWAEGPHWVGCLLGSWLEVWWSGPWGRMASAQGGTAQLHRDRCQSHTWELQAAELLGSCLLLAHIRGLLFLASKRLRPFTPPGPLCPSRQSNIFIWKRFSHPPSSGVSEMSPKHQGLPISWLLGACECLRRTCSFPSPQHALTKTKAGGQKGRHWAVYESSASLGRKKSPKWCLTTKIDWYRLGPG